jgi:hypothetical protein
VPIALDQSERDTEKAGRKGREGKCYDIIGWVRGGGGDRQLSVLLSQSV